MKKEFKDETGYVYLEVENYGFDESINIII